MNNKFAKFSKIIIIIGIIMIITQILIPDFVFAVYCDYYCEYKGEKVIEAADNMDTAFDNAMSAMNAFYACYNNPNCDDHLLAASISLASTHYSLTAVYASVPAGPVAIFCAGVALLSSGSAYLYNCLQYDNCNSHPDCSTQKQNMTTARIAAVSAHQIYSDRFDDLYDAVHSCSIHHLP